MKMNTCKIYELEVENEVGATSANNTGRMSLRKNSIFKLNGDSRGISIRAVAGSIWITVENDPKDYVLEAGDEFVINKEGVVIAEALTNAAVTIRQISEGIQLLQSPL